MLKKVLIFLFFLLLYIFPANAQTLTVPVLKPGQFVYTVPENFDPPLIGKAGVQELEKAVHQLHYPYFIVLVKDLPGGTDQAAADMIDGFAAQWASRFPQIYDPSQSQIFLLTYQPRKYRFLAGATFKKNLGFEREAHKPFTDLFEASVKGTPKVPKTGILEMMVAVDQYLFEQTDPGAIQARRQTFIFWVVLMGILALLLFLFVRFRLLKKRQQAFEKDLAQWQKKIDNAFSQYARFQTKERDAVVGLKEMGGETGALYQQITEDLDEIALSLEGLENHFQSCADLAAKAHLLSVKPLKEASQALIAPFEFDTGQVNKLQLFGTATIKVSITAPRFLDKLQKRFEKAQRGWNKLTKSAEKVWQDPKAIFPLSLKEQILQYAPNLVQKIQHPLLPAGGEADVEKLYQELETLRWQDALAYEDKLNAYLSQHQKIMADLEKAQNLLVAIQEADAQNFSVPPGIQLKAHDKPENLLKQARQLNQSLQAELKQSSALDALIELADRTLNTYRQLESLMTEIKTASRLAPGDLELLENKINQSEKNGKALQAKADDIRKIHSNFRGKQMLQPAFQEIQVSRNELKNAAGALTSGHKLEAYRQMQEIETRLSQIAEIFQSIEKHSSELQYDKSAFERELTRLKVLAEGQNAKLASYGSHFRVYPPSYSPQHPENYAELLNLARACPAEWAAQVRQAQQAFEHQEKQRKQREERQRDKERRDREARRRERLAWEREHQDYHATQDQGWQSASSDSGWGSSDSGNSDSGSSWEDSSSSSGGSW